MDVDEVLTVNILTATLTAQDRARLRPHLTPIEFRVRQRLEVPNQRVRQAIFIESGIVSGVALQNKLRVEVGLIGREGMTGLAALRGGGQTPQLTSVQSAGHGLSIPLPTLARLIDQHDTMRHHLDRFSQLQTVQAACTTFANAYARLPARIARWLLMARDRLDGEIVMLTHEFLATILAVRRAGVTEGLHELQVAGVIRIARGLVEIVDPIRLRTIADTFYGLSEREYRRLFGRPIEHHRTRTGSGHEDRQSNFSQDADVA